MCIKTSSVRIFNLFNESGIVFFGSGAEYWSTSLNEDASDRYRTADDIERWTMNNKNGHFFMINAKGIHKIIHKMYWSNERSPDYTKKQDGETENPQNKGQDLNKKLG
jgi:hypothetical protein